MKENFAPDRCQQPPARNKYATNRRNLVNIWSVPRMLGLWVQFCARRQSRGPQRA
jgi:hypothetical protein